MNAQNQSINDVVTALEKYNARYNNDLFIAACNAIEERYNVKNSALIIDMLDTAESLCGILSRHYYSTYWFGEIPQVDTFIDLFR